MRSATPRSLDRPRAIARVARRSCAVVLALVFALPGCSSAGRDAAASGTPETAATNAAAQDAAAPPAPQEQRPMPEEPRGAIVGRVPAAADPVPTAVEATHPGAPPAAGDVDTSAVPAELLAAARADLAQRLVAEKTGGSVRVLVAEAVTWSDGALGCPRPGMNYTMALVPGYRVVFGVRIGADERRYAYHAGHRGPLAYCANPGSPVSGSGAI